MRSGADKVVRSPNRFPLNGSPPFSPMMSMPGLAKYLFTLPLQESGKYYRVHVLSEAGTVYSSILPPFGQPAAAAGFAFPDPATNFVYLTLKANNKYTGAYLISNT